MKKVLALIVAVFMLQNLAYTQSNNKQDKYWRYRQKLVSRMLRYGILDVPDYDPDRNLFYPIGGYSLPAGEFKAISNLLTLETK